MKLSLERAFRVVWLVVGGLLLLFLLVGGVLVAAQWIGNAGAANDAVRVATQSRPAAKDEARAVRYDLPLPMRGTSTRLVLVSYGKGYEPSGSYGIADTREGGAWVNAIFVDGAGARPLLDRPAYIRDVDYPNPVGARMPGEAPQTWITYVMALDDSDRNGRLDARDETSVYVTDLEGRGLRRVLDPPLRFVSYQGLDGGRMLVYALEPPAGERVDETRMRQRAFIYDVAAGRLAPYAALDSAAARAGQIVGR